MSVRRQRGGHVDCRHPFRTSIIRRGVSIFGPKHTNRLLDRALGGYEIPAQFFCPRKAHERGRLSEAITKIASKLACFQEQGMCRRDVSEVCLGIAQQYECETAPLLVAS